MRFVVLAVVLLLAGCVDPAPGTGTSEAGDRPTDVETRSAGTPSRSETEVSVEQELTQIPMVYTATQTVTYENDVIADVATILIDNGGDVSFRPGDAGEYRIEISLRAQGDTEAEARANLAALEESHVESDGLQLVTRVVNNGGERNLASIEMTFPKLFLDRLDIDTGSGDITVGAFTGTTLALDSGSGDQGATGFRFDTVSADSGSGDISLQGRVGDVNTDSGSGEQSLDLEATRSASWTHDAGSGDITLDAAGGAYDVQADTGSGEIELDFSDAETVGPQDEDSQHVRTRGFASAPVQVTILLDTGSGDISASG